MADEKSGWIADLTPVAIVIALTVFGAMLVTFVLAQLRH
jgi:hypothetical protein